MKPLKLDENQIDSLMRLCKKFLPEYHYVELDKDTLCVKLRTKNSSALIHWFELMWILADRMFKRKESPIGRSKFAQEFGLVCYNKFFFMHPVDYMYNYAKNNSLI